MSKKRIVTTSRGLKLDLDALKASQPQAKPIITGRAKEKPVKNQIKNTVFRAKVVRVNATVPAKRPKPTAASVAPTRPIVEKELEILAQKEIARPLIVTSSDSNSTVLDVNKAFPKKPKE